MSKWIDVREELPKDFLGVLVWAKVKNSDKRFQFFAFCHENDWYFGNNGLPISEAMESNDEFYITHWRYWGSRKK